MAQVQFTDQMLAATGGQRAVEMPAETYRDLLAGLLERWPDLADPLERSAVAIDGQIYQDAFLEPLQPHSEIYFMPRIEGG